tara:strand:- start:1628 stop:1849 length:222 start_codon:yes stop_codon:yes gene_type:complete
MPDTNGNNKTNKKHRNNKKNEKRKYNFNKTKKFGEGKVGKKIASAVTPKSMVDLIPLNKGIKAAKAAYNYMTS